MKALLPLPLPPHMPICEIERMLGPHPAADIEAANAYLDRSQGWAIAYGRPLCEAVVSGNTYGRHYVLLGPRSEDDAPLEGCDPEVGILPYVHIELKEHAWWLVFTQDVPPVGGEEPGRCLTVPLPKLEDNPKEFALQLTRYIGVWLVSRETQERVQKFRAAIQPRKS